MDRITFILIAGLVWIVTIILVIVVLTLINNKENFILYTYNNFCTFKVSCDEIFNESIKELNITILKIPFDEFKKIWLFLQVCYQNLIK